MEKRVDEIKKHLEALDVEPVEVLIDLIESDLRKRTKGCFGCISPGGSSVRSWIQYWLVMRGLLPVGQKIQGIDTVTCLFHFWPWDCDKYGPQPTGDVGTNLDTMRSPIWRVRDANPINRVACRVTNKRMAGKASAVLSETAKNTGK